MKLRRRGYLVEKFDIGIRPGKVNAFMKIFEKKVHGYLDDMERYMKVIDLYDRDTVEKFFYGYDSDNLKQGIKKVRDKINAKDFIWTIDLLGFNKFSYSLKDKFDYISQNLKIFLNRVDGEEDFGETLDDAIYGYDEIDDRFKNNMLKLASSVRNIFKRFDYTMKKAEDTEVKHKGLDGREPPKNSEKIETMYHASVDAQNLLRNGFSNEKPKDFVGLGGSSGISGSLSEKGISFTYDLYVAKEIARTFKELAMAAKGQLKMRTVKDWARREGILWGDYGKMHSNVMNIYDEIHNGNNVESPLEAVKMLISYYTVSKKRYDPLFVTRVETLYKKLKKINPRNIGVLVAKVDMTNVKSGEYVFAEREYRVTTDDIVKLVKVL